MIIRKYTHKLFIWPFLERLSYDRFSLTVYRTRWIMSILKAIHNNERGHKAILMQRLTKTKHSWWRDERTLGRRVNIEMNREWKKTSKTEIMRALSQHSTWRFKWMLRIKASLSSKFSARLITSNLSPHAQFTPKWQIRVVAIRRRLPCTKNMNDSNDSEFITLACLLAETINSMISWFTVGRFSSTLCQYHSFES